MTAPTVHPVDEVLAVPRLAALGLQHVLVMYAGAVAVPLIVGRASLHVPDAHPRLRAGQRTLRLADSLEAAAQIGMRFHAARGSMSVGQSQGGLPPDRVVEREDEILKDTQRLIERWHKPGRFADAAHRGRARRPPHDAGAAAARRTPQRAGGAARARRVFELSKVQAAPKPKRQSWAVPPGDKKRNISWLGRNE